MINWLYYPKSVKPTPLVLSVVGAFEAAAHLIDSTKHEHPSNFVLQQVGPFLLTLGFKVEISKKLVGKIRVPVLFGLNGKLEKSFEADAYHESGGFVVEVEAGRGVVVTVHGGDSLRWRFSAVNIMP